MSRIILTALAIIVVIGIALAATGVLHFQNTRDQSSITLDKKDLNVKAHEAVERTKEAGGKILDRTGETLHNAAEGLRSSVHDHGAPTTTPATDQEDTQPADRDKAASKTDD